jgi:catechol 2,3-dioxygenase-like lactoylglutathione lyase family enzyme
MQTVFPALRITDYQRSRAFYLDGLGFTVDWEHRFGPDFPVFVQISRNGQSLYLSEHAGDCQVGGLAYFYVTNVDAWYREIIERGLDVPAPEDKPWGNRELRLRDPDGNTIVISTQG